MILCDHEHFWRCHVYDEVKPMKKGASRGCSAKKSCAFYRARPRGWALISYTSGFQAGKTAYMERLEA